MIEQNVMSLSDETFEYCCPRCWGEMKVGSLPDSSMHLFWEESASAELVFSGDQLNGSLSYSDVIFNEALRCEKCGLVLMNFQ